MTTRPTIALAELAEKGPDADLLREMIQYVAQRMMELDAEGLCAAGYEERSPDRANSRNGYRPWQLYQNLFHLLYGRLQSQLALDLSPLKRDLLSAEAVRLAVDLMAGWEREERVQAVMPAGAEDIEARIARIEVQILAGVLEREDVPPALAALHERRRALLAAAWRQAAWKEGH